MMRLTGRASTALLALALALTLALPAQLAAQHAGAAAHELAGCDTRLLPLADTIRDVMETHGLPSVAVAVAQHGRVLCETAFGWADVEARVPATAHTMYSLASISKPVTATAVLQLVERGVIELDAPANRYLGAARLRAFDGDADGATIRRLLTHTAGLPLHYQFFHAGGPPAPTMDEAIVRWGVLVYPPGERYVYANFGFGVLDEIIARVSGVGYGEYLAREVFGPLGLADMAVSDGADLAGRAAVRYDNAGAPLPPYTFDHLGASAVWSSAHDLVRFGAFHLGRGAEQVLSPGTIALMQEAHAPVADGDARGLGWFLASDHGHRRVAHTGSMPGVATVLNIYPDEQLVVVVLTNRSVSGAMARVAGAIAGMLLPGHADAVQQQRTQLAAVQATRPVAAAQAAPPVAAAQVAAAAPGFAPLGFTPPAALHGTWRGVAIITGPGADETVPVVLEAGRAGVRVRIGEQPPAALENARVADGWLTGRLASRLVPPPAAPPEARDQHAVTLTLQQRGDRLAGWASSITTGPVLYGAVSVRVELSREPGR
jgi:CubicO group peptidase (beta-lactamase class C family)